MTANVGRAASLAAAEMSVYDQVKTTLLYEYEWDEGLKLHLLATYGIRSSASCPFDVCKSRLMSQPVDPVTGQVRYRGLADCMTKTLAKEGPTAFWKGFLPRGLELDHACHYFLLGEQQAGVGGRLTCNSAFRINTVTLSYIEDKSLRPHDHHHPNHC